jgi:hypothetical protein
MASSNGGTAAGAPGFAADKAVPEQANAGGDSSASSASTTSPTVKVAIAPVDRSIIYTAELTVRAKDVAVATDQAKQIVSAAGGYVSDEKSSSSGRSSMAVLTFKVPPTRYGDVLSQLGRNLGKRLSQHQGAEDVTEEVADVDSRVQSAKATLDQFRTLLSRATKIGEVLEIEREISTREADLEALQARQKALAAQTSMATITLELQGQTPAPPKPKEPDTGFLGGLKTGWKALVKAVGVGLTVFGVLLPWLVLAAAGWVVVVVVRRRARPPRTAPQAGARPVESASESASEVADEVTEDEKSPSA